MQRPPQFGRGNTPRQQFPSAPQHFRQAYGSHQVHPTQIHTQHAIHSQSQHTVPGPYAAVQYSTNVPVNVAQTFGPAPHAVQPNAPRGGVAPTFHQVQPSIHSQGYNGNASTSYVAPQSVFPPLANGGTFGQVGVPKPGGYGVQGQMPQHSASHAAQRWPSSHNAPHSFSNGNAGHNILSAPAQRPYLGQFGRNLLDARLEPGSHGYGGKSTMPPVHHAQPVHTFAPLSIDKTRTRETNNFESTTSHIGFGGNVKVRLNESAR